MDGEKMIRLMKSRRSVRGYLKKPVDRETVLAVVEAGRWAPSAYNKQPWKFIVVEEAEQKKRLIEAIGTEIAETKKRVPGFAGQLAPYLADVPVFIVVVGFPEVRQEFPANRSGVSADKIYYAGVGAAVENMQLAAAGFQLGTVFFTIGSEPWAQDQFKKVLAIPEKGEVLFCLPLGYPAQEMVPDETKRKPLETILCWNKYQE
ncbi:nitroreductase family protein [Candidatus Formimonas warabiya]|uniref:Nitroreductase domain-containing protein n=1 Tax=Formimonas warabiya TaxID=1761012 RepID=A0A3G1KXP2_FORW1|nr:nitroreductase family protein [Candidatus Formimonas warabiya]ATW27167.1 hypothetical protein DCMF_22610 [Candidatus Formimonas warabiya]